MQVAHCVLHPPNPGAHVATPSHSVLLCVVCPHAKQVNIITFLGKSRGSCRRGIVSTNVYGAATKTSVVNYPTVGRRPAAPQDATEPPSYLPFCEVRGYCWLVPDSCICLNVCLSLLAPAGQRMSKRSGTAAAGLSTVDLDNATSPPCTGNTNGSRYLAPEALLVA